MKSIFIIILVTSSVLISAQDKVVIPTRDTISEKDRIYDFIQVPPTFVGGRDSLSSYLNRNLRYPPEARSKNITGVCVTRFVVMSDGNIEKAVIVSGIGAGCDEEALRLVNNMPKWKPGMKKGKNVNVRYTLPIHFEL